MPDTDDMAIFVRIIERVRLDLAECERLLALPDVKYALSRSPEKVAWIRTSIGVMKAALQAMAHHTARVRNDVERGLWVGVRNRLYWLLEEREKLVMHTDEVARGHDGLLQVLAFLVIDRDWYLRMRIEQRVRFPRCFPTRVDLCQVGFEMGCC